MTSGGGWDVAAPSLAILFFGFIGHRVGFGGPGTQISDLTALRAKGFERIVLPRSRLSADGARTKTHVASLKIY
jgi:hypothetical protein